MAPRIIVVGAALLAMVSAFGHTATAAGSSSSSTTTCSQDECVDDAQNNVAFLQVGLGFDPIRRSGDVPVNYLPSHQTLICSCFKCGSTTLYNFVYEEIFHKPFNFSGWPHVKDVSARWEGEMVVAQASVMHSPSMFSFALVRDPKDRLLSAWKSKAACFSEGCKTDTDLNYVPQLLALAYGSSGDHPLSHGILEQNRLCLSFDEYLQALSRVHGHGDEKYLEPHFLPQQYGCFEHLPLHSWSQVIEIKEPDAFSALAEHLGAPLHNGMPDHMHSTDCKITMTDEQANMLDVLTHEEYAFFASAGITFD